MLQSHEFKARAGARRGPHRLWVSPGSLAWGRLRKGEVGVRDSGGDMAAPASGPR